MDREYREVQSIKGLQVAHDARFRYHGKDKKVTYGYDINKRKTTARIRIMIDGISHYWQASRLVAEAWVDGYEPLDYITYKDGDIHNIKADNLVLEDKRGYTDYMQRNSGNKAASLEQRKKKLQLVSDQALMTKRYFETLSMDEINTHVSEYLYPCLMEYCVKTLHLGERISMEQVPNCIARMYECIINGMCLYNYERYCKKLLLNYKKKKDYGHIGSIPKPIKIEVEQLNFDCLWEKYKVKRLK